jgi:hypothetical protein
MKYVELTNSERFAAVDDEDYDALMKLSPWSLSSYGYAKMTKRPRALMHRVVMKTPLGLHTDHINADRLDNRKENLRICTASENIAHQIRKNKSQGGYKGVQLNNRNTFQARLRYKKQLVYIGTYKTAEDAARAYDKKARELFGEFAITNFQE